MQNKKRKKRKQNDPNETKLQRKMRHYKRRFKSWLDPRLEKLKVTFSKENIIATLTSKKTKKAALITLISLVVLCIATFIGLEIYSADYYRADTAGISEIDFSDSITVDASRSGIVTIAPASKSEAGIIFYPGGKVEYISYLPLMYAMAERGIYCVLVEMPYNLAVLDINAADRVIASHPEIEKWYIGGHSLGGSMAASYAAANKSKIEGVFLLGSYSTVDLTHTRVITVYGTEDGIMNRSSFELYKSNLPSGAIELEIHGANHAYFGFYGEQAGDGTSEISRIEQIEITADNLIDFIEAGR